MAVVEDEKVDHLLQIAQLRFELAAPTEAVSDKDAPRRALFDIIEQYNAVPIYDSVCEQFGIAPDAAKREAMVRENEEKLRKIDEQIRDAEENLGDSEIREGFEARAVFFYNIGDKDKAVAAFAAADEKTVAVGQKLDLVFFLLRLGLAFNDFQLLADKIERAKTLIDEGGDWEKRNRLKAYEGVQRLIRRDVTGAAALFLDTLATFTSFELMDMRTFVLYTGITSLFTLDRVALRRKVIDSPEVLAYTESIPHFGAFVNDLYNCSYGGFVRSLAGLSDVMARDRILAPHVQYVCRELRIKAYAQYLHSYRSVSMASMSRAFGVSAAFLDRELSRFVAMGRLDCKIDLVAGIVETQHRSTKNAMYATVIKQGDLLLNRISKMARVTDM